MVDCHLGGGNSPTVSSAATEQLALPNYSKRAWATSTVVRDTSSWGCIIYVEQDDEGAPRPPMHYNLYISLYIFL